MKADDILIQARAKVIWGEPSDSVRGFLISNGVSDQEADAKIKEFSTERNQEIRRAGIRKFLIGAAIIVVAGGYFYFILSDRTYPVRRSAIGLGKGPGIIAAAAFYGLWQLIGGIIYLVRPRTEEKSITEI
jgi:hypothetical protein